jgi:hypothetical protein
MLGQVRFGFGNSGASRPILGGFAADPPTGWGSTSQLIMRTYPDARLRADARGRDGGVREELEAGAKGVDRPSGGSIQNDSDLSQGRRRTCGAHSVRQSAHALK